MEQYKIILESQLGPREGTLQLEDRNGRLKGTITLLGYENPVSGKRIGKHLIRLSHHLHTQISDLSCISVFEMEGNTITGTLQNDQNVMKWHGKKENSKKGGNAENGGE
jgi:hypothetical protein